MMSDDNLDANDSSQPDPEVMSTFQLEEIVFLERLLALPDTRPDPGYYCYADETIARAVAELERMMRPGDPRPLLTAWRPYETAEDLFEDASGAADQKSS